LSTPAEPPCAVATPSARQRAGTIRIGISGWRYPPWRGVFYPKGLAQTRELAFASRALASVEINGSFYSLQHPQSYAQWYAATPPGFVFAVKANRYLTHFLRLNNVAKPLANFLSSGLFNLREKLGPILWQFPENFRYRPELLEDFLALLPRDTGQALAIARRREARMHGRARLAIDAIRPLRHAIEVRSETFADPAFVAQLRRHDVALVVADTAGKWLFREDVTADFVYIRLHGDEELYASGYGDAALERWAGKIRAWSTGREPADAVRITEAPAPKRSRRDVYCYFDNDRKVHAPFDARRLIEKLDLGAGLVAITDRDDPSQRTVLDPERPYPIFPPSRTPRASPPRA
jgi:uncharacterized protein YecE (DUF72 family)